MHQTSLCGFIQKMPVALNADQQVQYTWPVGDDALCMNELLGQTLTLSHTGAIACVGCKRSIKKTFQGGYCFPCTQRLAACDLCIVKPERCHYHLGTCREPSWGDSHCMQQHWVYLANTSGLKVGITRGQNIPSRWIDQGASSAIKMFSVPTRLISGLVEVTMAEYIADKTNWRRMLKGPAEPVDLVSERLRLFELVKPKISEIGAEHQLEPINLLDTEAVELTYPVIHYPEKVTSLNLDKTPEIIGKLVGIKGQYLILDTGVLNVRKWGGYELELAID